MGIWSSASRVRESRRELALLARLASVDRGPGGYWWPVYQCPHAPPRAGGQRYELTKVPEWDSWTRYCVPPRFGRTLRHAIACPTLVRKQGATYQPTVPAPADRYTGQLAIYIHPRGERLSFPDLSRRPDADDPPGGRGPVLRNGWDLMFTIRNDQVAALD